MMPNEDLLQRVSDQIVTYDADKLAESVKNALDHNVPSYEIVSAMSRGMQIVGHKFEEREYFLPDLLMAAEAMKSAMDVLEPYITADKTTSIGKVLIGTVEGDIHDIGKNIVIIFLKSAGFDVHDLGTDVPVKRFIEEAKAVNPDILGMSGLLSTSLSIMGEVIEALKKEGLRDGVKVLLGGSPVTDEFGKRVGADATTNEALSGIRIMEKWMEEKT
jgi:corrinoid protein of di/trimethylamine methyltransferase